MLGSFAVFARVAPKDLKSLLGLHTEDYQAKLRRVQKAIQALHKRDCTCTFTYHLTRILVLY